MKATKHLVGAAVFAVVIHLASATAKAEQEAKSGQQEQQTKKKEEVKREERALLSELIPYIIEGKEGGEKSVVLQAAKLASGPDEISVGEMLSIKFTLGDEEVTLSYQFPSECPGLSLFQTERIIVAWKNKNAPDAELSLVAVDRTGRVVGGQNPGGKRDYSDERIASRPMFDAGEIAVSGAITGRTEDCIYWHQEVFIRLRAALEHLKS